MLGGQVCISPKRIIVTEGVAGEFTARFTEMFGEDLDEARRVAGQLNTGGAGINSFLGAPIQIPFGGTKRSGVGRELGRSGMDQFANITFRSR